ncbi:hypothetical protein GCM10010145_34770 [Streptomyces ruber]|uniref:Uncharacterized protein n=2 Tax=Streptomyces TaxID=1883 RepID=A0A918BE26_9ACTN|nr:hypothetical protein GCM10010145_34770 [Streptomyces ruber]
MTAAGSGSPTGGTRYTRSVPRRASRKVAGSYQSKRVESAPGTGVARRDAALTRCPAASRCAVTRLPVVPVAPMTRTVPSVAVVVIGRSG